MMSKGKSALALALVLCSEPAWALPRLIWPVDCEYGKTCFIQNYVDRAFQEKGVLDHKCGDLTYDEHRGIDIRPPFREVLYKEGLDIFAASDGIVEAVFNADEDFDLPPAVAGRHNDITHFDGCGVGVMIDHRRGWKTLYCHLMPRSVDAKEGDKITQGQIIGKMGESGNTTFPHLHFEVMHWGRPVDPFQPTRRTQCDYQDFDLWDKSLPPMEYRSHGVIMAGMSNGKPDARIIRSFGHSNMQPEGQGSFHFWMETFGMRTNDYLYIEVKKGEETYWKQEEYYLKNSAIDLISWSMDKPYIKGLTATVTILRGESAMSFAFEL